MLFMSTVKTLDQKLVDRVSSLIQALDIGQVEAARQLKISQGHLNHVLAGKRPLSTKTRQTFGAFERTHQAHLPTTASWRENLAAATARDNQVLEIIAHIMHNLEQLKERLQDVVSVPTRPEE